jgi:3-dehydroquinate synthase
VLEDVIRRCCHIKARVVQQDERETTGLRAILNYGHTIGHAVEAVTGFTRYCHGEAVSIGMIAAAGIAVRMGLLEAEAADRQRALLLACGLPTIIDEEVSADAVLDAVLRDKKTVGGRARFVIPLAVGKVVVKEGIPRDIIEETLAGMKEA